MSRTTATATASASASGGIGLGGAIFIVFLVLKLIGKITWSWWWVTSPLWIPFALGLGFLVIGLIIYAIVGILTAASKPKRRH